MTILCYHAIDPDWSSPIAVTPTDFAAHAGWLARNRRVVPLAQAVVEMDRAGRLPRGTNALTFDDGFASVHALALPLLRRLGLPATVFVVAETLAPGGREVDWVDDPPARGLRALSLDQVLEMLDHGVSFGSHSFAHRDLTTLSDAEVERDLRDSRELLEALLDRPVPFLAYPRGRNNDGSRRAAARAGYSHAFTLPERREPIDRLGVPRAGVYRGNSVRTLRVKASRRYLAVRTSPLYPLLGRLLSPPRGRESPNA